MGVLRGIPRAMMLPSGQHLQTCFGAQASRHPTPLVGGLTLGSVPLLSDEFTMSWVQLGPPLLPSGACFSQLVPGEAGIACGRLGQELVAGARAQHSASKTQCSQEGPGLQIMEAPKGPVRSRWG